MERILLTRRKNKREKELLDLLTVDDSGMVIWPGRGSVEERTGSPARMLIEWHLYKTGTKPLDYDIYLAWIKS